MKTVYDNGKKIQLTKEIGGGQEAIIYDTGANIAIKVYRMPKSSYYQNNPLEQQAAAQRIKTHQKKLGMYPRGLPSRVVTPLRLVTNKSGVVVGYMMPLINKADTLLQYSNRSFREQGNIDNTMMTTILRDMHTSIEQIHATQTVIGDFNDMNVLIQGTQAYFIDTDSWQFPQFPCTMFTSKFVDPLLCKEILLNGTPTMILDKPHTAQGDWYAYNVMMFKSLLYVDPYGGNHKPTNRSKKIKADLRPLHRITVFDSDVIYPKPARHWHVLPDELLHHFQSVFVQDQRTAFPEQLLTTMRWTTCTSCGIQHARPTCPTCTTINPDRVAQRIQVRGQVTAHRIFRTSGVILTSDWQQGTLRWLYHEQDVFKRENKRTISHGDLSSRMRYRIQGDTTIFADPQHMIVINKHNTAHKIAVDSVGNLPIVDTNGQHTYWIHNGQVKKNNAFGIEYQPTSLGSVIRDQTLLWTGKDWGFGLWRAQGLMQGFIFTDDRPLINESLKLPKIQGSILDATTVFSEQYAWFMYTSKLGSKLVNTCIVCNRKGTIVDTTSCDTGEDHWLGSIRGKDAAGDYIFSPQDDGITRTQVLHGGFTTKEYPDTAPFVDSQCVLHITPTGIYVQSNQEITLLSISSS